jgi:LytR cell envelope-related transcriptional attenuator
MEHTLSRLDLVRPWRTTALVASAVAVLELALLLIVGFALFADALATDARTATAPNPALPVFAAKPKPRTARPKPDAGALPTLARDETSVLVLNGNGRAGAAGEAGSLLHAHGYIVARVGNAARSDYGKSVVMYRPGREVEARRLAREVGVDVVGPLDGIQLDELMGAHVVVVIGAQ